MTPGGSSAAMTIYIVQRRRKKPEGQNRRTGRSCGKIVEFKMLTNIGNVLRSGAQRSVSMRF